MGVRAWQGAQVTCWETPAEAGFQLGPASPSGVLAASGKSSGSILRAPEGRGGPSDSGLLCCGHSFLTRTLRGRFPEHVASHTPPSQSRATHRRVKGSGSGPRLNYSSDGPKKANRRHPRQ